MTEYRYPLGRIVADCSLFGSGAVMCAGVVALASTVPYVVVPFGGLTAAFLVYTIKTAYRHRLRIAVDAEGMTITGGKVRTVKWAELEAVRLRYYSNRRNRKDGWMTMTMAAAGRRVTINSHLSGFDELARQVATAANRRGLALDRTTASNFAALGFVLPEPQP